MIIVVALWINRLMVEVFLGRLRIATLALHLVREASVSVFPFIDLLIVANPSVRQDKEILPFVKIRKFLSTSV